MRNVKHHTTIHTNVRGEGFIVDGGSIQQERPKEHLFIRSLFELIIMYITAGINNGLSSVDILEVLRSVHDSDGNPLWDDMYSLMALIASLFDEKDVIQARDYIGLVKMLEKMEGVIQDRSVYVAENGRNGEIAGGRGQTERSVIISGYDAFGVTRANGSRPQIVPGGIDLNPALGDLITNSAEGGIRFHFDPAQLQEMQNAVGFVPVIINLESINDLKMFLGLSAPPASAASPLPPR